MTAKDWITLIVPSLISILGLIITYNGMKKQFKNSIEQENIKDKKKVYLKLYTLIEDAIEYPTIVLKSSYIDKLKNNKAKLFFVGSEEVIYLYNQFYEMIYSMQKAHNQYIEKCNSDNYEKMLEGFNEEKLKRNNKGNFTRKRIESIGCQMLIEMKKDISLKKKR